MEHVLLIGSYAMAPHRRTWAIVLAGGDGTRLADLTTALYGRPIPKQFATIAGRRSMVQETLHRLAPLVPSKRTAVVVGRAHLPWARAQLSGANAPVTLVQSASRGTATAIALALRWIQIHDRDAEVIVSPSDHHVAAAAPFRTALARARDAARATGRVTLVGVTPEYDDPDFGWIVPGPARADGCWALARFVEKPDAPTAAALRATGALWNTFLLAGAASSLWALLERHLPAHARTFDALDHLSFAPGAPDLAAVFEPLAAADFSRDVLQRACDLDVVAMTDWGWDDWGTPARVLRSLGDTAAAHEMRARLAACRRGDPIAEVAA